MTPTTAPTVAEERRVAKAQREALLAAFELGQVVNRKWAHDELDIFELSARIVELEERGYVFEKGWMQVSTRYGHRKVRSYKLVGQNVRAGASAHTLPPEVAAEQPRPDSTIDGDRAATRKAGTLPAGPASEPARLHSPGNCSADGAAIDSADCRTRRLSEQTERAHKAGNLF